MALHEFSIYIVPYDVKYVEKESTWKFEGVSHINCEEIIEILQSTCKRLKDRGNGFYSDKKYIDAHIINSQGDVKALEIKGCLSCYKQATERAYQIAKAFEERRKKVYFNVLGKSKDIGDFDSFLSFVCSMYDDKIKFFKEGHEGFCYIIPPSKYYCKLRWYTIRSKLRKFILKI